MQDDLLHQKEVRPLALSRDSSNGPDWKDIASALIEIQESWGVTCTVRVNAVGRGKFAKLMLSAQALIPEAENGGVNLSGSASVILSAGGAGAMEQALFRLVHELDADLYRKDMGLQGLG